MREPCPIEPHPQDSESDLPWSANAQPIEVAPGLYMPSRIEHRFLTDEIIQMLPEDKRPDFVYELQMELIDYVYNVRSFTVEACKTEGISSRILRSFPVGELVEYPGKVAPRVKRPDGRMVRYEMYNLRQQALEGPTEENLIAAARVYAVGYSIQVRPTGAVEDALGLKRSTAENWVRRAKDKGYVFAEA